MATQDPSVYIVPPAEVVGNAFARQYYAILEQSPTLVYRFYQDISKLGRTSDNGLMASTTTMDAINEKIQSYGSLKADIKYVDAQDSYNGGVIVLVTGSMVKDDDTRWGFTQTFFLAPQDKGYFVLNDIFRYVDEVVQHNEKQDDGIVPPAPCQEEKPTVQENHVVENHVVEESNGEVFNPHENGEVPIEDEEEVAEEEPVAEVVDEAPNDSQVVVESRVKVDEAPNGTQGLRKSYASIVLKDTPVSSPSTNLPKSMTKVQEQQKHAPPSPVPVAPPSNPDSFDDGNSHEPEGDHNSIYLKDLPHNVPYSAVEEALKRFGTVKTGSIQIRHAKGFNYGFVDFEEAGAAQSAIEASPITIAGREVVVEEKRSGARGSGRRYPIGRGGGGGGGGSGGFRGDGSRGRGSYGGGRGYVRSENRSDYGNRGGRGHYHQRNEGFQKTDQTGHGSGRGNRGGGGGGSGIGYTRAHSIPAQA